MDVLFLIANPAEATITLSTDALGNIPGVRGTSPEGREGWNFTLPAEQPNGAGITITATQQGYVPDVQRGIIWLKSKSPADKFWGEPWQTAYVQGGEYTLQKQSFPVDPPTRAEVLGVRTHFRGGLIVNSPTYGKMPWWPTALTQMDEVTRQEIYRVTREAGDTHQIVHISNGKNDHRNETFYDQFPWVSLTNNLTKIDPFVYSLIDEVIAAGFKVVVTMDETQGISQQIVELFMRDLPADRVPWILTLPGYDGVFYGWEPSNQVIPAWAAAARKYHPDCYLGIEFNPGHIPLGNGAADYFPGGNMDGFDCLLGEFPTCTPPPTVDTGGDQVWQVSGRLIRPYHRPPEQPAWDDPNPPFYLVDSPRGPRAAVFFETWEPYEWVRVNPNDPAAVANQQRKIQAEADYARSLGWTYIC